jgi:hypothetical protein
MVSLRSLGCAALLAMLLAAACGPSPAADAPAGDEAAPCSTDADCGAMLRPEDVGGTPSCNPRAISGARAASMHERYGGIGPSTDPGASSPAACAAAPSGPPPVCRAGRCVRVIQ